MNKKLAIQFNPFIKTRYAYMKLKICRNCNHFTVLGEEQCGVCGKKSLISVDKRADNLLLRSMWKARGIVLLLLIIGLLFSQSATQVGAGAAGGVLLLALLWVIQKKTAASEKLLLLEKIFQQGANRLTAGLTADRDAAIEVFQNGNKPLTYEMLREIGALVQTDQLRIEQILLLQTFLLRKDMDLMLDPLIMGHFNPDLAEYIGELSKIRRDLIKEKAFRYILLFESQIIKMEHGESILIGVAGAAVRMKRYVFMYQHLVMRYAGKLPKDRFLRLYHIVLNNPHTNWAQLSEEVLKIYDEKYKWDEDFHPLKQQNPLKS